MEKGSGFRGWVARQTEQASQMEALTKVQSLLSAMTVRCPCFDAPRCSGRSRCALQPDELSQGPAVIKRREKLRLSEASSMVRVTGWLHSGCALFITRVHGSQPVPDINVFFKQFEMTKGTHMPPGACAHVLLLPTCASPAAFHAWIRYRHKNNLPLPTSMDEAHVMLKESPAGFPRVDLGNTPRSLRRRVR